MTPSARFADYVLPDTMNQEIDDMQGDAYAVGDYNYIVALSLIHISMCIRDR